MFKFLHLLFDSFYKSPKKSITFFSVLFLVFSSLSLKVEKNIVIKDQIDKNSIDHTRLDTLEKKFEKDYQLFVLLNGDVTSTKNICDIYTWLRNRVLSEPNFTSINSVFNIRDVEINRNNLHYPKIIDLDCKSFKEINYKDITKTPWDGIINSQNNDDLLFTIVMQKNDITLNPPKFNANVIKKLENDFSTFLKEKNLNYDFNFLGWVANRRYVQEGIQKTFLLNIILFVLILILFKYFFGTFKSGFLLILTLVIMGSFLFGLMSLFKIPIDMLNAGLFLLLSISALQDFIFLLSNMQVQKSGFYQSAKELLIPSFFTSFTTIIGFGSLYLTNISTLQHFGVTAAFAALVEWVLVFLFLPSFISLMFKDQECLTKDMRHSFNFLEKLSVIKPNKMISAMLLVAYLIGSTYVINPRIHEEPFGIFKEEHPFSLGINKLVSTRQWSASFDIIFESDNIEENKKIIENVKNYQDVAKVISYYDIEEYLTRNLKERMTKDLVIRELNQSDIFKTFKNDEMKRAIVYIKRNEVSYASQIKKHINNLCKNNRCFATGNLIAYTEFGEKIPRALIESFTTSLILVSLTLLVLIFFTIKKNYIPLIMSSMWGPFACLTLMKFLNIPFNYITCLFASIIVGLTGDNAIQFLFKGDHIDFATSIQKKGIASYLIVIFTSVSSIIFVFGYFKFSKEFGIIMILGNLLSIIGDIWILNSFKKD